MTKTHPPKDERATRRVIGCEGETATFLVTGDASLGLMNIQQLDAHHAAAYQGIRLQALRECPTAFNSSYEEERERPTSAFEASLVPSPTRAMFGAFSGAQLVGTVSVGRDERQKVKHKGSISGVYVSPDYRYRGLGKGLLAYALDVADSRMGLVQLTLLVNAANTSAISLYESFGFKSFGLEPAAALIDGVFHSEMHMVRLAPDVRD